jgi:hypothetical protein
MAHHRTDLHSQHLRSPFRNLYSHLSLSLVPRESLRQISLLGQFPSILHSPFPISTHSHTALWAVPFQPPFSIPDLHSLADCPLGGSLPAYILHSRSPFARIYFYFCSHSIPPFLGPFPSGFHSPFPISIRTHLLLLLFALNPTLPWTVPFRLPFPFSDLRFGARRRSATTFAEAQRWQEV